MILQRLALLLGHMIFGTYGLILLLVIPRIFDPNLTKQEGIFNYLFLILVGCFAITALSLSALCLFKAFRGLRFRKINAVEPAAENVIPFNRNLRRMPRR